MGYITNHSFNLKFSLQALGTPANPNFKIVWSRFSSDKEGVQYNSVGLYLQRSYSKTNAPGQVGTTPAAPRIVVSTTPTVEAGWTTIKSWSAAETAALPDGTIVRYQDNSSQVNPPAQNQTLYAYRLIYYAEESGSNYEIDYRPASATGGSTGTPGAVIWATSLGGSDVDYGNAVVSDRNITTPAGMTYVTGVFSGTASIGGFTLTSSGGYDVFLAKYNAAGACQWAVRVLPTTSSEVPNCIALDLSGNVYIGGAFTTGCLVKLNSSGAVQWTHGPVASGTGFNTQNVSFNSIAVDSSGNIAATGSFVAPYTNPMDFGNSHPLTSVSGSTDAFLAQYSTTGVCNWAKNFSNFGDSEVGTAVAIDSHNDIFLAGYSLSGIDLGGGVLSNLGSGTSGFLGKFDSNGNLLPGMSRATGVHTADQQGYSRTNSVVVDSNGDVIIGGAFNYNSDFGGGNLIGPGPASQQNSFVAKYSGNDLSYRFAIPLRAALFCNVQHVAVDAQNNAVSVGSFTRSCNFGTAQNPITLTSLSDQNTTSDVFVAKCSATGTPLWAKQFGGTDNDLANCVDVDTQNQIILTGSFYNNVNGTAAPWGSGSLTSHGNLDCFLTALRA